MSLVWYLVLEFVGLVLVMNRHGQDGRFREIETVRLVHLGQPFLFGKLRRHVVDVFHPDGSRARTWKRVENTVSKFYNRKKEIKKYLTFV